MSDATFRPATEETPLARRLLIGLAVAGLAIRLRRGYPFLI